MKGSLVAEYAKMHAQAAEGIKHFPGRSILRHAWIINQLMRKVTTNSILDYGCGLGLQYQVDSVHKWWGIRPTLYDPAVEQFSARPDGTFDGVICSDVMEHIPRDEVRDVIKDVYGYARGWVFFSICCRASTRTLPNGEPVHCTLLERAEWEALLKLHGRDDVKTRIEWSE